MVPGLDLVSVVILIIVLVFVLVSAVVRLHPRPEFWFSLSPNLRLSLWNKR